MLKGLDKGLAVVSWVIAGVLALMLLIGPRVIADDKGKPAAATGGSPYAAPDGKRLFASNCGSCHTLKEAGTNGQVGPNLDSLQLTAGDIKATMKAGPGAMPSFSSLPPASIDALAKFVASSISR